MGHSYKSDAPACPRRTAAITVLLVLAGLSSCGETTPGAGTAPATAPDELREPPVFASANGVLDLLVIAKAAPILQFAPYQSTGWVYRNLPPHKQ